ncbi:MAG TPA: prepilin-type N-terminal cleavage/methylation domain-containing protein [Nitrospiria bacterium]|jgi:prepilin-type N-terminal cleavage/methylation domain-containing protein|nr:prepilin-type N-terminal cleavage/methylation domain-containing protein [Nitrospiria bacterium]
MRRFVDKHLIPLRKGRLAGEGGMTLLEVAVSLVILAVGLLAVSGMQIMSIRANSSGFKFTTAAAYADKGIVNYANLPYADPQLNAVVDAVDPTCVPVQNVVYNCQYTVVDNTPITGVKTITYTVSWFDGGNHSVSLVERVGNSSL